MARSLLMTLAVSTMACASIATPVGAQTSLDNWKSIPLPPPPDLERPTIDTRYTALLILDMAASKCNDKVFPSCARIIPNVKRLLDEARARKMLVIYGGGPATSKTPQAVVDVLAPVPGDPTVRSSPDKFYKTNLEQILRNKKITTVIVTGTSAQGTVLYTASAAAIRGFKAVVPTDGYSSDSPFAEFYTAWHLAHTPPSISANIVLSRSDLIKFN